MSNHDEDLRGLLRQVAERAKPGANAEAKLLREARRRRRITAAAGAMVVLVLVGGLAGATTLVGDGGGIKPAPGPEETGCVSAGYDAAVFIEDGATEPEIQRLRESLAADAEVDSVTFMSKKAAFEEFKEHYADQPEFWENLPEDALPMSFRVRLRDDADLDAAAQRFNTLDQVEAVRTRGELSKEDASAVTTPGCPSNTFARYSFEVAKGEASASGVLEVSSEDPSICLTLASDNIIASHLLWLEPGRLDHDAVVLTFFDPHDGEEGPDLPPSGPHCFASEQLTALKDDGLLQRLVDAPAEFRIDFHRGPDDEPGLVAELVPVGEDRVDEVESFAAALFKDDELDDAVPDGFSLREIIRNGPDETNHDYATVGVQMNGPVSYARVIFFVHPTERDAAEMEIKRSEALTLNWKAESDGVVDALKPFAVSNALPGSTCGSEPHLLTCHAALGRIVILTQSGDRAPATRAVTNEELEAAKALIRSFGSYLERIYPQDRLPNDGKLTELLEDTIEAQGGTIRLRVVPMSLDGAQVVRLVLTNATTGRIGVGNSYLLESNTRRGWSKVESPPNCVPTLELLLIEPGDSTRDVVGGYDKRCRLADLAPGEHRVTKEVELESGDWVQLSVEFAIGPPPARFLSIDDAVAHLSDKLEVPVALPRELPDNIRLAPKRAVSMTTEGGIRSGRVELRYGKDGILSFDFGRAIFDGCGGDGAEQVDINGEPGLMLAKDEYPWTQIIWPAKPGDREATYGIYGSLPGTDMLELARSMPHLRGTRANKREACL